MGRAGWIEGAEGGRCGEGVGWEVEGEGEWSGGGGDRDRDRDRNRAAVLVVPGYCGLGLLRVRVVAKSLLFYF